MQAMILFRKVRVQSNKQLRLPVLPGNTVASNQSAEAFIVAVGLEPFLVVIANAHAGGTRLWQNIKELLFSLRTLLHRKQAG